MSFFSKRAVEEQIMADWTVLLSWRRALASARAPWMACSRVVEKVGTCVVLLSCRSAVPERGSNGLARTVALMS